MLSRLAEQILISFRFSHTWRGGFAAPLITGEHGHPELADLEVALKELQVSGFATTDGTETEGYPIYRATTHGVVERERKLRRRGVRHRVFSQLGEHEKAGADRDGAVLGPPNPGADPPLDQAEAD